MRSMLQKLDDAIEKGETFLLAFCLLTLVLLTGLGFIARKLFGYTSMELLDLQPAVVLWISLVGGSLALKHGKHIRLELLLRFAPDHLKTLAHRLGGVFGLAVMLLLLYLSYEFVSSLIALKGWQGYLALMIPIFFVLAAFRYAMQIVYPHP